MLSKIPKESLIESELPIKKISKLARKEGNYKKPIYRVHKWWARRLGAVVRSEIIGALLPKGTSEDEFWGRFYSKNSIEDITVLDPFMGGGTCVVEPKKMGAKTIGVDINPLACFITEKELEECNIEKIKKKRKELKRKVGSKIKEFYTTKVDGENHPIINLFWVYEVECPSCNKTIESHSHYKLYYRGNEQVVFCKECGQVHNIEKSFNSFQCKNCGITTELDEGPYYRGYCTCENCEEKFQLKKYINGQENLKMFALEYEKGDGNKPERYFKNADKKDKAIYKKAKKEFYKNKHKYKFPESKIPTENREDMRPITYGYKYYKELFNERQLLALGMLYNEILKIEDKKIREFFIAGFSDSLACNNLLCNYAYGYRKLTPLFSIHAYTVPARPVENNVWGATYGRGTFEKTIRKIIRSKKFCKNIYESDYDKNDNLVKKFTKERVNSKVTNKAEDFYNNKCDSLILNKSSEKLDEIKNESVDLILTDPPYYDNLHYSELADFYYQWIKNEIQSDKKDPMQDSLYVNESENNYHEKYTNKLTKIFKEGYAKLTDNGLMIFSYHHNKQEAWTALGRAIKNSGFIITNVLPIRSEGSSGYHSNNGSIKWDSIIVSRKKETRLNAGVSIIEQKLNKKIDEFEDYIETNNLKMKRCDKVSFYRSIAIMIYTQISRKNNIDNLLEIANKMEG